MFKIDTKDQWEYLGRTDPTYPVSRKEDELKSPFNPLTLAQMQACLTNSIAVGNFTILQKYLNGESIFDEPYPQTCQNVERKVRRNIQLLVRSPLPETISLQEILNSIEKARIKILTKDYAGTTDKLCNALVGWIVFHISDLDLVKYAAQRTPEDFPGERLERWKRLGEPRGENFNLDRLPRRFSTEPPIHPFSSKRLEGDSKLKGPLVFSDTGEVESTSYEFTFLLERETNIRPSSSDLLPFIEKTVKEKITQLKKTLPIPPSPQQIKEALDYTVIHLGYTDGKLTNLGAGISEEIKGYPLYGIFEVYDEFEPSAKFFVQNIHRVFQESLSLIEPVKNARVSTLENVFTNVPVLLEQEWRRCFPNKKKTGGSYDICTVINNILWTMNGGDCKVIVIKEDKAFLATEETSPSTHGFGAGNSKSVTPRAKVTCFPLVPPIPKRLVSIILGNPFLFATYSPREIAENCADEKSWKAFDFKLHLDSLKYGHKGEIYIARYGVDKNKSSLLPIF